MSAIVVPCEDYLDVTSAQEQLCYEPKFQPTEAVRDYVHTRNFI
jgi:hypothetical protein